MHEKVDDKLIEKYIVPAQEERIRMSDLKAGTFKSITSRKGFKNAIKKGLVKINGEKGNTGDFLIGGEIIEIFQSQELINKPEIDLKIEVLYEDDYLAVINKPAGITVSGNKKWTLENALSGNLKPSKQNDALIKPEPIHRLDHPTSGAILVGKTISVVSALNKLFEKKQIEKEYIAVTIGRMPEKGQMKTIVGEKEAITDFIVEETDASVRFEYLNLVRLNPHTGRRHQLRIQLAEMGNQILGDRQHGLEELILKGKGLYLHSAVLAFLHPVTGKRIHVKAPLPNKFIKLFPNFNG